MNERPSVIYKTTTVNDSKSSFFFMILFAGSKDGASKAAKAISCSMDKRKISNVIKQGNDNRQESRFTSAYREETRKMVEDSSAELLLDVNTFPADDASWSEYNVVILYDSQTLENINIENLMQLLRFGKIRTKVASRGVKTKSKLIMSVHDDAQSRAFGKESFLLEFNQGNSDEELEEIAETVAEWSVNFLSKKHRDDVIQNKACFLL